MKDIFKIREELEAKGWIWFPNYKNIEVKIWPNIETYFDNDETILSALWASFKRYDLEMVGMIFITDKRIFTLEIEDNNSTNNIRYVPIDMLKVDKVEFKKSVESDGLNSIHLQNDTYGNGIEFNTPNKKVAQHFLNTLAGISEIEIVEINDEPSDLKSSAKIQELKDNLGVEMKINFEEPNEIVEDNMAQVNQISDQDALLKINEVKLKKPKVKRETKKTGNKYFLFIIPVIMLVLILAFVFAF
ncbi:PH domain-containing protein [Spiroplasma endosymbiont of Panorpa germanica]|uniref:PH domain-containing protein n=1 Tax=Spiroplasma endosymbiont of Panorpa germanica TaxID=3066314 RepID=UPI0030D432B0